MYPTKEEINIFYDEFSKEYGIIENRHRQLLPFIMEFFKKYKIPTEARILDAGCGTGFFAEMVYHQGYKNLTLVDISKGMLKKAKKRFHGKGVEIIRGDIAEIDTLLGEKQKFDVVLCITVLHYLKLTGDLKRFFSAVKRILAPQGVLIVFEFEPVETIRCSFKKVRIKKIRYALEDREISGSFYICQS